MFLVFISQGIQAFQTVVGESLLPLSRRGASPAGRGSAVDDGGRHGGRMGLHSHRLRRSAHRLHPSRKGRTGSARGFHRQSDHVVGEERMSHAQQEQPHRTVAEHRLRHRAAALQPQFHACHAGRDERGDSRSTPTPSSATCWSPSVPSSCGEPPSSSTSSTPSRSADKE